MQQHIERLWKLNESGLEDMEDVKEVISALNIKYGVRYKQVAELNEDDADYCSNNFQDDVEDTFIDKINTKGITFPTFKRLCELFMDFSRMYNKEKEKSKIFNMIAESVRRNNELRFGMKIVDVRPKFYEDQRTVNNLID